MHVEPAPDRHGHAHVDAHHGSLYHHHEGWVLDDGSQLSSLPSSVDGCMGGGMGNSHAEKPWVIFFQPYLKSREVGFCPSDTTPRSRVLARNLKAYNGAIESTDEEPPADSELAIAERSGSPYRVTCSTRSSHTDPAATRSKASCTVSPRRAGF